MKRFFLSIVAIMTSAATMVFAQTNTKLGDFALHNNTTGFFNTAIGYSAMISNTVGNYNVAVGHRAMFSNITGNENTVVGQSALHNNTTGSNNTALGYRGLGFNTTGNNNVAIGNSALLENRTGSRNIAIGNYALAVSMTGRDNIGIGDNAMFFNTAGFNNVAIGNRTLNKNTTGYNNVATGHAVLKNNTTGVDNVARGHNALHHNTTGSRHVAAGSATLYHNTTGQNNTALGYYALYENRTGDFNTALGFAADVNGHAYNRSTALGFRAIITASDQVRIGWTGITSVGGYQNWTNLSDGRFKKNIQENVKGLEFINALRPVSYSIDHKALKDFLGVKLEGNEASRVASSEPTYQTGFIAQEVEATAKKLGFDQFHGVDAPKNENDHYGLRYAEFVVPLVKSVQELSTQNEEQQRTIQAQQAFIDEQQTSIDELKAMLAQQQTQIEQLLQANTLSTATTKVLEGARLGQNAPNPFSVETQIQVEVPATAQSAFLQVSTLEGKQLFIQSINERGVSRVTLAAGQLPAGIYLYTLVVDDQLVDSRRMILTK